MRSQLMELPEAAFGQPDVPVHRELGLPETVFAREKSDFRIEVVADLCVTSTQPPRLGVVGHANLVGVLIARNVGRLGPCDEAVDEAVLPEAQPPVSGVAPVVVAIAGKIAGSLAVHEHGANRRPIGQFLLHARDAEVVRRDAALEILGRLHVDEADAGIAVHPPCQAAAGDDGNRNVVAADADGTAEEHFRFAGHPDRKETRVLEEERPFLGKKQIEAIEVDLLLVDFDLSKVGVVGGVERQARRQAVLQVDAELAVPVRAAGNGTFLRPRTEDVRRQLKVALSRYGKSG